MGHLQRQPPSLLVDMLLGDWEPQTFSYRLQSCDGHMRAEEYREDIGQSTRQQGINLMEAIHETTSATTGIIGVPQDYEASIKRLLSLASPGFGRAPALLVKRTRKWRSGWSRSSERPSS